jgi:Flp pilus assembly protein protease CpaA
MMATLWRPVMQALDVLSTLFVVALFCGTLFLLLVFVLNRRPRRDAVLRNYPVIKHARHILSPASRSA